MEYEKQLLLALAVAQVVNGKPGEKFKSKQPAVSAG